MADTTKGGHVRTRVIVWLKPSVPTTVGKKFVKPFAERCKFCMRAKRYNRGSPKAAFKLSMLLVRVDCSTVSRLIRACASRRSSSVNQDVVRGWSGRMGIATRAVMTVTMPSIMNSLAIHY